jgi:hypothetical protein
MLLPATVLRLYLALGLFCYVLSHPLRQRTVANPEFRALGGLLGDGNEPLLPADSESDKPLAQPHHLTVIHSEGLGGLFNTDGNKASSVQTTSASSAPPTSPTVVSGLASPQSSTPTLSFSSPSIPSVTIGVTKEAPITPPAEAAEWKVIGIAAVSIGLVAGIMLSIVFFDSWWGFLRALVGKKKENGAEDLVPDWARRDWEFKIASEDGHRYPTLSSLEFMTKSKQDLTATSPFLSVCPASPMRPPSLYLPSVDPHPLEPLFRRPSAASHTMPPQEHIFRA